MRIIAGRWRGHTIAAPPGEKTRPTTDRVREAWMSTLQHDLPDAHVLDLFAGSGALGLEALSRGAARVTFVEKAVGPLRVLEANVQRLGASAYVEILKVDALKYVAGLPGAAFDIALADPPYAGDAARQLIDMFLATPFARILSVEHGARDAVTGMPDQITRRYGDTALTFITAPE